MLARAALAQATPPAEAKKDGAALLDTYMRALETRRLAPQPAERVEELSEALEKAPCSPHSA
jgi:hypothetical protein